MVKIYPRNKINDAMEKLRLGINPYWLDLKNKTIQYERGTKKDITCPFYPFEVIIYQESGIICFKGTCLFLISVEGSSF